jgi:glycosyltransferase involved in cell wall biosynthesis
LVQQSFLNKFPVHVIHNGVDLQNFDISNQKVLPPLKSIQTKTIILGVASTWDERKGLHDFKEFSKLINDSFQIVLIGLSKKQIKTLSKEIIGIERTEDIAELAAWYQAAKVFVNPTYQDNFPTTNIEALACGTPVVTYNTGGSPEAIDQNTGRVIKKGDVGGLKKAVEEITEKGKDHYQKICRNRAEKHFNKDERYLDYIELYRKIVGA